MKKGWLKVYGFAEGGGKPSRMLWRCAYGEIEKKVRSVFGVFWKRLENQCFYGFAESEKSNAVCGNALQEIVKKCGQFSGRFKNAWKADRTLVGRMHLG